MKVALTGSTGLVGREVLAQALADRRIAKVTAITRKPLPVPAQHADKLRNAVVDFDALSDDASLWQADAAICTLGTTLRTAGSKQAFRQVDYDLVLAIAHRHLAAGTPCFVLNSARGANRASPVFYSQVKGELEHALKSLGFASLVIAQPGLIGGKREEHRSGEVIAQRVLGALAPVLPLAWRINEPQHIARAMLDAALNPPDGTHMIASADMHGQSKRN